LLVKKGGWSEEKGFFKGMGGDTIGLEKEVSEGVPKEGGGEEGEKKTGRVLYHKKSPGEKGKKGSAKNRLRGCPPKRKGGRKKKSLQDRKGKKKGREMK